MPDHHQYRASAGLRRLAIAVLVLLLERLIDLNPGHAAAPVPVSPAVTGIAAPAGAPPAATR